MKPQFNLAVLLLTTSMLWGCDRSKTDVSIASDRSQATNNAETPRVGRKSRVVSVTGTASEKMKSFLNGDQRSYIRLSVKNGGPTGFMYDLKIDDVKPTDSDIVDESNGFLLITDAKSSLYLDGATIDWETRPDGSAGFKFDNPNAIEK